MMKKCFGCMLAIGAVSAYAAGTQGPNGSADSFMSNALNVDMRSGTAATLVKCEPCMEARSWTVCLSEVITYRPNASALTIIVK